MKEIEELRTKVHEAKNAFDKAVHDLVVAENLRKESTSEEAKLKMFLEAILEMAEDNEDKNDITDELKNLTQRLSNIELRLSILEKNKSFAKHGEPIPCNPTGPFQPFVPYFTTTL